MLAASDHPFVADYLRQSAEAIQAYRSDPAQIALLGEVTSTIVSAFQARSKLLLAGNGGSAGDAQHIAGEFTGRMLYDRPPLPAIALSTDTSAMTAIGNDYGFETIFERQVNALGQKGDVLLALSTSGNSPNVVRAIDAARNRGMITIGFTGAGGGLMAARCDLVLRAPSAFTPVIQQVHMVAAHIVCSLVERAMFPPGV